MTDYLFNIYFQRFSEADFISFLVFIEALSLIMALLLPKPHGRLTNNNVIVKIKNKVF